MTQPTSLRDTQAIFDFMKLPTQDITKIKADFAQFHSDIHEASQHPQCDGTDPSVRIKDYEARITAFETVSKSFTTLGETFGAVENYLKPAVSMERLDVLKESQPELYAAMKADVEAAIKQFERIVQLHKKLNDEMKQVNDGINTSKTYLVTYQGIAYPSTSWLSFGSAPKSIPTPVKKEAADANEVVEPIPTRNPQTVYNTFESAKSANLEQFVKANQSLGALRAAVDLSSDLNETDKLSGYVAELTSLKETVRKMGGLFDALTIAQEQMPSSKAIAAIETIKTTHSELYTKMQSDAKVAQDQLKWMKDYHQTVTTIKTAIEGRTLPKASTSIQALTAKAAPVRSWFSLSATQSVPA